MTQFDYQGVLTSKKYIAPDTVELKIRLVQPTEIHFTAGQFVNIQAGDKLFRPYSIASAPSQKSELHFAIKLVKGGKASAVFEHIQVGSKVNVKGPFGKFVVSDEADRPDRRNRFIFVASGTGLAPVLSQLKALFEQKNHLPKTLYFGFYDSARYLYREMLETWEKEHLEFRVVPVVSDQPVDVPWEGERGFVTALLEKDITDVNGLDVYVCGNPLMVQAVKPILLVKGVDPKHVHEERF
ncbi:MAG: FAD-binding oxidoreductase [Patescibacteria group bacterium]